MELFNFTVLIREIDIIQLLHAPEAQHIGRKK